MKTTNAKNNKHPLQWSKYDGIGQLRKYHLRYKAMLIRRVAFDLAQEIAHHRQKPTSTDFGVQFEADVDNLKSQIKKLVPLSQKEVGLYLEWYPYLVQNEK
jgi:hypothetical protein